MLREALAAPPCGAPFSGLQVIALSRQGFTDGDPGRPLVLEEKLNAFSPPMLRSAVADLVSKGLLHDEGVGRYDTRAMQYFIATDTARWLAGWIVEVAT